MNIVKIRVISELNEGIYASERAKYGRENADEFEPTKANLIYALDMVNYRSTELVGCYGGRGGGNTWAEIETGTGDLLVVMPEDDEYQYIDSEGNDQEDTISEDDAFEALTETVSLSREQLRDISGHVWDGNNHVLVLPNRSENYCNEDANLQFDWGVFECSRDSNGGAEIDYKLAEGWLCLGWIDYGGYQDGELTRDQFDLLLEANRPPKHRSSEPDPKLEKLLDSISDFYDEEFEIAAMFCRTEDLSRVQSAVQELVGEEE